VREYSTLAGYENEISYGAAHGFVAASALTLRPDQRLLCNINPTTRVGLVLFVKRITTRLIWIPTHPGYLIARMEIRAFTAYPRWVLSAKAKVLFVSLLWC
jgi:hypothetical protein